MNCTAFSNLLDAWLDGKLSPEDQAGMEAHAAECPDCAALTILRRDCRELDEVLEVPAAFSAAWREAIRREAEPARKKTPWRGILTAAAALVFVVGGTLATRSSLRIDAPMAVRPTAGKVTSAMNQAAEELSLASEENMADAALPTAPPMAMAASLPAAANGTSQPTYPPVPETAAGKAESADMGAPGRKSAETFAVTNVQFSGMYEAEENAEAEEALFADMEESDWAWEAAAEAPSAAYEAAPEEPDAAYEAAEPEASCEGYMPAAAEESDAAYEAAPEETPDEEGEPQAEAADSPAAEASGEAEPAQEAETRTGALREIGLTLLCALPWIAVAAAVLLILKRKEKNKTDRERKE